MPARRAEVARIDFYRKTGKIHPRAVSGRYARWRTAMLWFTQIVFYGGCWLQWNGRQALLFDIAERKFHFFGLVLWPQDALLLALLLIISATALFLVTAVAGRLFCGFACPQTVYTALFRWVEARVEGDHLARMRLDEARPGPRKLAVKATKHGLWLAIAAWTGITFVGYFTPVRELVWNLGPGELGGWAGFWVFFYAGFTYLQAGFAREMVCLHMCPYSRFQGVMMDADTVTVGYDARRGEPRKGRAAARAGQPAENGGRATPPAGDCVDCTLCVQVCPTGIDIRDGLQYECINCGLCIDACDDVMQRVGSPTGLIRFASGEALAGRRPPGHPLRMALARPRVRLYLAALVAFTALGGWMLANRIPLRVDVLRDRTVLLREAPDGSIENTYTLKISNMREAPASFRVRVEGAVGPRLLPPDIFHTAPGSVLSAQVTVAARPDPGARGPQAIRFVVEPVDPPGRPVAEESTFLLP